MKKLLSLILFVLSICVADAQNVGIGTSSPNASAQLDITATNKGLLIPRVALTSITDVVTIPSPANSLLVYNTTIGVFPSTLIPSYYFWNGTRWTQILSDISSGVNSWLVNGNGGTSPVVNFIGTADNQPLAFKINNNNAGYLGIAGNSFFGKNSGNPLSTGDNNTAVGAGSLVNVSTGYSNVALGTDALGRNDVISNLVAVGDSALYNNGIGATQLVEGTQNTAIGSKVLFSNTTGNLNSGVGTKALQFNTTGVRNNAFGSTALKNNITGSGNNAFGRGALTGNQIGNRNVAIGDNAMNVADFANNIIAIGDSALYINGIGHTLPEHGGYNTAIGSKAMLSNLTGHLNTAIGYNVMMNNTSGYQNTALGVQALLSNTTGNSNTAISRFALVSNTTGSNNIAIGTSALLYNNTGSHNIAIGSAALDSNINGDNTIAIGDSALYSFKGSAFLYNTAIGYRSQYSLVNAGSNTSLGYGTLFKNNGEENTAMGHYALTANTLGTGNSALGSNSLEQSYGDNNSAFGVHSLLNNLRGDENTAVGERALLFNSLGNRNVGIGAFSLAANFTGSNNTGIGNRANVSAAGLLNATAIGSNALVACSNCISLGSINGINGGTANTKVGIGTTTPQTTLNIDPNGSGGILIGYDKYAGGYTTLEMGISAGSNGRSYIQSTKASGSTFGDLSLNPQGGNVGIHMNTPLSPLHIKQTTDTYPVVGGGLRLERNANTNHWEMATDNGDDLDFTYNNVATAYINHVNGLLVSPSDLRLKKDINSIGTVLPALMQLQPKTYHYKTNEDGSPLSYGFIAQEVEKLFPDFVITKGPDNMKAIAYQEFTIVAIKAIQEQQEIIEKQNKRIEKLEAEMELLLKNKN